MCWVVLLQLQILIPGAATRCLGADATSNGAGQTPEAGGTSLEPEPVELHLYGGLTLRGTVGAVYAIESTTQLESGVDAGAWGLLEHFQLPTSPYRWTDTSHPVAGRRFYRAVPMPHPAGMVFIPPGTFRMGSPEGEEGRYDCEGPQTAVTIRRGFWMGRHEVTQGEYAAVMGQNPSAFPGNPERPVERVSWEEAVAYCATLTAQERQAGRIAFNAEYRLPTEAEWEYACRAWTSTRFSFGEDLDDTEQSKYAWFRGNSSGETHSVEQKLPNPWGLYDMHGNVWEWCGDWFASALPGGIVVDPQGPTTGSDRVIRGGGWFRYTEICRSAYRDCFYPTDRNCDVGFRVVLAPGRE